MQRTDRVKAYFTALWLLSELVSVWESKFFHHLSWKTTNLLLFCSTESQKKIFFKSLIWHQNVSCVPRHYLLSLTISIYLFFAAGVPKPLLISCLCFCVLFVFLLASLVYSVYCGPGSVHQRAGWHRDSAWGSHRSSGPQWQRTALSAAEILRGCQWGNEWTNKHVFAQARSLTRTSLIRWFYLEIESVGIAELSLSNIADDLLFVAFWWKLNLSASPVNSRLKLLPKPDALSDLPVYLENGQGHPSEGFSK